MVARLTRRRLIAGSVVATLAAGGRLRGAKAATPTLKDLAKSRGILYGSSVASEQIRADKELTQLILGECAAIVPEAEMKWGEMIDASGHENYTAPDQFMAFAAAHDLAVRGHTLIWFRNVPDWYKDLSERKSAEAAMLKRIAEMAGRYRGRVFCWDVVNEAIHVADGRPDGLRRAVFLDRIGPDYIDIAHHAARAADPAAALVVNDYGIEYDTPADEKKRAALLRLLERMKKAGTPVDALGVQAHLEAAGKPFSATKLQRFFADVAAMGLGIHITELDVRDTDTPASIIPRDRLIADQYARFLEAALAEPAVTVLVTWGLTDRYTWLNRDETISDLRRRDGEPSRPLLFDKNFARKPAYDAVAEALRHAPARAATP